MMKWVVGVRILIYALIGFKIDQNAPNGNLNRFRFKVNLVSGFQHALASL